MSPTEPSPGNEYTWAPSYVDVAVVEATRHVELPRSGLWLDRMAVSDQVGGYERRKAGAGELLGYEDLDLPPARLRTVASWYMLHSCPMPPTDDAGFIAFVG